MNHLKTDLVTWHIERIAGESGGFVDLDKLIVTIHARVGKGS